MGAETFHSVARGTSAKDAFHKAVEEAKYNHGHGGYSGTIAEKHNFVAVGEAPTVEAASALADKLIGDGDARIDDKWGPAGCITVPPPQKGALAVFYFFGWASS